MSLFQCPNLRVPRSAIWRVYRESCCPSVTSVRTFYIPVPPQKEDTTTNSSQEKADRLSGTWYVPDPTNIDYKSVLARFPQLPPTRRRRLTSALFLVTPKLAKWFDVAHPCYQEAINHIYQPVLSDSPPQSVVAVVDALPSPKIPLETDTLPLPGHEGIAICLMSDTLSSVPFTESQSEQSLIRFHTSPGTLLGKTGSMISATLPTANTLFVNGLSSTMFKQEWTLGEGEEQNTWTPRNAPVHLSSLNVLMPFEPRLFLGYFLPLQQLTPARRIVSSMGNVLRELEGDDGTSIRASTELEHNVPQYIKKKEAQGTTGSVKVFALVMPPAGDFTAQSQYTDKDVESDEKEVLESSTSLQSSPDSTIHGSLIRNALNAGGRVIRVTGGGGGWGKKQGLLSLDDKVNFSTDAPLESGMFPSLDDELPDGPQVTPAELLPPGHTIQFFAAWVGPGESAESIESKLRKSPAASYTARTWSKVRQQKWILGTGTTNEGAHPQRKAKTEESIEKSTDVYCLAKHFGMLSHTGICVARESVRNEEEAHTTTSPDYDTIHQFRIDVPHTALRCFWSGPPSARGNSSPGDQEQQGSDAAKPYMPDSSERPLDADGNPIKVVARNVSSLFRDAQGRVVKVAKRRRVRVLDELVPSKAYSGRDVVGFENLDKLVRIVAVDGPDVDSTTHPRTDRRGGGSANSSRQKPDPPKRTDWVNNGQGHVAKKQPAPFAPFAPAKPAELESADADGVEKLNPIVRLYNAPNKVSWDRPRANVKPGQAPS